MRGRTRWAVVGVVVVLVAVLLAAVLYFAPVFRVRTVEVSGTTHYTADEVQAASGIATGDNLLRFSADAAAAGIATLPWVLSASVERVLPDTVSVDLEERTPVLYLGEGEGAALIDTTGTAFTTGTPPEGTVQLVVNDDSADTISGDVLSALITAVTALDDATRGEVASVTAPTDREIEFTMRDGRTVYWGTSDEAEAKARAMRTALTQEGQHWNVSAPQLITVS